MLMRLGEIQDEVEQTSERWPAEMTAVQLSPGADPELAERQLDAWESWLA